jgi:hypothetical protein
MLGCADLRRDLIEVELSLIQMGSNTRCLAIRAQYNDIKAISTSFHIQSWLRAAILEQVQQYGLGDYLCVIFPLMPSAH